ncbi:MAG: hypothetical protein RSD36_02795 [Terrisporobacter sp.]
MTEQYESFDTGEQNLYDLTVNLETDYSKNRLNCKYSKFDILRKIRVNLFETYELKNFLTE